MPASTMPSLTWHTKKQTRELFRVCALMTPMSACRGGLRRRAPPRKHPPDIQHLTSSCSVNSGRQTQPISKRLHVCGGSSPTLVPRFLEDIGQGADACMIWLEDAQDKNSFARFRRVERGARHVQYLGQATPVRCVPPTTPLPRVQVRLLVESGRGSKLFRCGATHGYLEISMKVCALATMWGFLSMWAAGGLMRSSRAISYALSPQHAKKKHDTGTHLTPDWHLALRSLARGTSLVTPQTGALSQVKHETPTQQQKLGNGAPETRKTNTALNKNTHKHQKKHESYCVSRTTTKREAGARKTHPSTHPTDGHGFEAPSQPPEAAHDVLG